ncbi:MAG TPA: hypothetical protein VGI86_10410 [Acidimicrobiia bacterium]
MRSTRPPDLHAMMTAPADQAERRPPSTARVATLATIGVLLFGLVIGGGLYWSLHRFGSKGTCPSNASLQTAPKQVAPKGPQINGPGWQVVGDSSALIMETAGSAYYLTMGGRCEYWLIVRNNTLYAYKARLPGSTCAIIWNQRAHSFICNATKEIVPLAQLPEWPARMITSGTNNGSFEINFS